MSQKYFAVTTPGLEQALHDELRALRTRKRVILKGGVEFEATNKGFYQAVYHSRVANRIYLRLDSFRAKDTYELHRKSKRFAWERVLPPGCEVALEATTRRSKRKGTGEIENTVLYGIQDHFKELGETPPTRAHEFDNTPFRLLVRLEDNRCTLSIDAAGRSMHQRGWRQEIGRAPLRENVACALLNLIGWKPGVPLLDPMCGAGTFVIEAARMHKGLPPRQWSDYAFHHWANFQSETWEKIVAETSEPVEGELALAGSDNNKGIIGISERNAERAEITEEVSFQLRQAQAIMPHSENPGFVVLNPPYGARLPRFSQTELDMFTQFIKHFPGWTMGMLMPEAAKPEFDGLHFEELTAFRNGGMPVRFWKIQAEPS